MDQSIVEVDKFGNKINKLASIIASDDTFYLYSTKEIDELGAFTRGLLWNITEKLKPGEIMFIFKTPTEVVTGIKTPVILKTKPLAWLLPWKMEEILEEGIQQAKNRIEELIRPETITLPDLEEYGKEHVLLVLREGFRPDKLNGLEETLVHYEGATAKGRIKATFLLTRQDKETSRILDKAGVRSVNLHRLSPIYLKMIKNMKLNIYHLINFSLHYL